MGTPVAGGKSRICPSSFVRCALISPVLTTLGLKCVRSHSLCILRGTQGSLLESTQLAVFAVHYLDELSALGGPILRRQALSLNDCLKFLLENLYTKQQVCDDSHTCGTATAH